MRKNAYILFMMFGLFMLSYIREYTFLNINAIINNESPYKTNSEIPSILLDFSHSSLYAGKYVLSVLFVLISLAVTLGIIRIKKYDKSLLKIAIFSYTIIALFCIVLTILTRVFSFDFYIASLFFLKVLLLPAFPLLFVVLGEIFFHKGNLRKYST